jgi:hypothetical protein
MGRICQRNKCSVGILEILWTHLTLTPAEENWMARLLDPEKKEPYTKIHFHFAYEVGLLNRKLVYMIILCLNVKFQAIDQAQHIQGLCHPPSSQSVLPQI